MPDKSQIKPMFEAEGLEPFEEMHPKDTFIKPHRHPFDEVRMVVSGQMILNITGNKLLLRPGDKIIIPSNTMHSTQTDEDNECLCICAHKSG